MQVYSPSRLEQVSLIDIRAIAKDWAALTTRGYIWGYNKKRTEQNR